MGIKVSITSDDGEVYDIFAIEKLPEGNMPRIESVEIRDGDGDITDLWDILRGAMRWAEDK